MAHFTNHQLQFVIAQLDQALYNHDQWYKRLLRVLISHLPPEQDDLLPDGHRRCLFGQWYESPSAAFLHTDPTFISLGQAHQQMHDDARILLQLAADNKSIPLSDFDRFDGELDRMRLELQVLRNQFSSRLQNRDPLTGAQNRVSLLSELRKQHILVKRGKVCALALFDLDHFKRINDKYGHVAGDEVLVSTVQALQDILRPYDHLYRYGGEEFLLCMPSTTLDEAKHVANRMCNAIAGLTIDIDRNTHVIHVTASFGVASLSPSRTVENSISCADQLMYQAKNAGRNCVVVEE